MRHVLTLVDARVVVIAALFVAGAAAVSIIQERRRGRGGITFWSLLAPAAVVLMTIANRGVVVSVRGLRHDLTWWTRNWNELVPLATGATYWWHWWLNVALFVPLGLAWTILTLRPRMVLLTALGIVLTIETLHATVLSGAGDPTDVLANMIGASAGVGIAVLHIRRSRAGEPAVLEAFSPRTRPSPDAAFPDGRRRHPLR